MEPKAIYATWVLLMLMPLVSACFALWVHSTSAEQVVDLLRQDGERRGLRMLLHQTLVPVALVPTFYRNIAGPPIPFLMGWLLLATLLLFASGVLCSRSAWLLARNSSGAGRIALPLLSGLDFIVYLLLFLCNFVTP